MKTAKITTLIAAILFLLSGVGIFLRLPQLASLIADHTAGPYTSPYAVPVVDFIFAAISFGLWLYMRRWEQQRKSPGRARLAGIALLVLSMFLPTALMIWFILLPIYNISSTAN